MNLGTLINKLEKCNKEYGIQYDFCNTVPYGIHSYRGFYEHLAIGYSTVGYSTVGYSTVEEFLKVLKGANGKVFTGYKGGNYLMNLETKIWIANLGFSSWTGIKDINVYDEIVVIETQYDKCY